MIRNNYPSKSYKSSFESKRPMVKRKPVSYIKKKPVATPTINEVQRNSTTNITKKDIEARMKQRLEDIKKGKYKSVYRRYGGAIDNQYGLGGLIGAGVGAIAGIPLGNPLLGAAAGASIGSSAEGMITGNRAKRAEEERQKSLELANRTRAGADMGNYAKGGFPSSIGKNAYHFTGKSHAQGGITLDQNTEIEGNETMDTIKGKQYVFSDRLTLPNSKKTFAQRHKELMEQKASKESINSLVRMQERVSGRSDMNQQASGGYKKLFNGGVGLNTDIGTHTVGSGITDNTVTGTVGSMPEAGIYTPARSFNTDLALQLAPDIINAGMGIFAKDSTRSATKVPRTKIKRSFKGYNINPMLQSNRAGYRSILSSPGATINQKLAAQGIKQQADSQAYATKANKDQEAEMRYDLAQGNMDASRAGQQAGFNEQYRQDRMASDANLGVSGNYARTAYSNIANKLLMNQREENMSLRDKQLLEMYRKIYGGV